MKRENFTSDRQRNTVRKILDTAAEIFAESGFAGARVDEIARRAEVNKATIYYHIGGKEDVYTEVISEIFGELVERVTQKMEVTQSPEERLKIYIRTITSTLQGNPYMAPIMLREVASGGASIPKIVVQNLLCLVGALTATLEEGEKQGIFGHTIPIIVHFMIVGSSLLLKTSSGIATLYDGLLPEELKSDHRNLSQENVDEIERLVLQAVKKS